jgi:hypothetical protein
MIPDQPQFITFGFACTPLYFVWEKLVGAHTLTNVLLRAIVRIPVVLPIWFLAIIFPFFGPINSAVGALLVTFTVYIIPAMAHMVTYRTAAAREVLFLRKCMFILKQHDNTRKPCHQNYFKSSDVIPIFSLSLSPVLT